MRAPLRRAAEREEGERLLRAGREGGDVLHRGIGLAPRVEVLADLAGPRVGDGDHDLDVGQAAGEEPEAVVVVCPEV